MNKGLNAIKNIIWVMGIFAAVLALVIGIVFSVSNKYYDERPTGTLDIRAGKQSSVKPGSVDSAPAKSGGASMQELNGTQDAGMEYVFSLTYLCDSTIMGLNDYSSSYGGTGKANMWTDDGSGLPVASASKAMIISPSDGSRLTPVNAAMVYQPKRLVIYIGSDFLSSATEDSFVSGYTKLIKDIQTASPNTSIACCSLIPIAAAYTGSGGYTLEQFERANAWIADICRETGVQFADLASHFRDSNGYMKAEYASHDGRTLGPAGISELINYFRFHASI